MLLIISIITINGISATGVPRGTRWAKALLGIIYELKIICPSQRGRANLTLTLKCLDGVKVKGERPIKFISAINQNKDTGNIRIEGDEPLERTAFSSPDTARETLLRIYSF